MQHSLKQVRLVPAGCQKWHRFVLDSHGSRFAFCSTLSVYVHSAETFQLERVLVTHQKTVSCMAWDPRDGNRMATCGLDGRVSVWDVAAETETAGFDSDSLPLQVAWSPSSSEGGGGSGELAVLLESGRVLLWACGAEKPKKVGKLSGADATSMRWSHRRGAGWPARLAVGTSDGRVCVYDRGTGKAGKMVEVRAGEPAAGGRKRDRGTPPGVKHLEWDPLSNQYLLVTDDAGRVTLLDTESMEAVQRFERQPTGVSSVAFVPGAPGDFVTVSRRSSLVTRWNVSQPSPVEVSRVPQHENAGVLAVHGVGGGPDPRVALAFSNGAVGVWSVPRRKLVFTTRARHSETVFDCAFSPSDPNVLVTASFDGSIKAWDARTMESAGEAVGQPGVLYGLSMAPPPPPVAPGEGTTAGTAAPPRVGRKGQRVAACSSRGEVWIYDLHEMRATKRWRIHGDASYRVAWHPASDDLVASTSADGNMIVWQPSDGTKTAVFKHPGRAYGVDWCPQDHSLLVTGCSDGAVRVWDLREAAGTRAPVTELKGHTGRVFNTVWSPLLPRTVASGSDDQTVRVWDTASGECVAVLRGHTANVRALRWSTEVPHLLFSGSWDGTVRAWNARSGECVAVNFDHSADVYGLAVHPTRPFTLVSSSRDTTLRVLGYRSPELARARLRGLFGGGAAGAGAVPSGEGEALRGPASAALGSSAAKAGDGGAAAACARYAAFFSFFDATPGVHDLWALAAALVTGEPAADGTTIPRAADLRAVRLDEAARQLIVRGLGRKKAEARRRRAAQIYAELGMLREYCEIMAETGEWDRALAVAPGVGLAYWRELAARRGRELAGRADPLAVPVLAAAGCTGELVDALVAADELSSALVVAVSAGHAKEGDEEEEDKEAEQAAKGSAAAPARENGEARPRPPAAEVRRVTAEIARRHMAEAQPALAACAWLSVGDAASAVRALARGNEAALAHALGKATGQPPQNDVVCLLVSRMADAGMWAEAAAACRLAREPEAESLELLARASREGYEAAADAVRASAGLPTAAQCVEAGAALEEAARRGAAPAGAGASAVLHLAAGGLPERAAALGLDLARDLLSADRWCVERLRQLSRALSAVDVAALPARGTREAVMLVAAFAGAQEAMLRGYTTVAEALVAAARTLSGRCEEVWGLPVPRAVLSLQLGQFLAAHGRAHGAAAACRDAAAQPDASEEVRAAAAALLAAAVADGAATEARRHPNEHVIAPVGSSLPSGFHRRFPCTSALTGAPVTAGRVAVGAKGGGSFVTEAEAAMWSRVNPFSPLADGSRLLC